ncbi:UDP-N-acetylmuramoyl-L-alanine--D-glutamate ligase [Wansuia hejianensis]|uniref:UDP-N-acetylmuramoylalanine--D-glutamate ligase n=1 Tax=Wansuia hejianensis TaxID=2763667 RepID=A0A926INH9_9FIRM|nr:UDP-N-acetylmuramoyl-L-alanine--D-glutamate ligase [Wansuia hejianensis]MBC8590713.1 UDP-N-acetylmuramoyl-L-alanine--D-glutamate ligase [Wansuia hejianensis]
MNLNNKEVLVIGLGISGITTIKAIHKLGANISISDTKQESELREVLDSIKDIPLEKYLGTENVNLDKFDLIIKSPGIPPTSKLIKEATKKDIKIITDMELGYLLSPTKNLIAITGTNGKTTTTTLTGEILKKANHNTFVVGNIGVGILDKIIDCKREDVFVIEASSFQLENTIKFKPKVSVILNLSPDHLDWHGSYDNYIESKKKVFRNQDKDDYVVLNYDDSLIRTFQKEIQANIIWFSVNQPLDNGIYLDGDNICISCRGTKHKLLSRKKLKLLGKHNLENILASIGIGYAIGIDTEIIKKTICNFKGVEHRLEYVLDKNQRRFYNDSKGTNVEASIKAIEAIEGPIILIAGGYDKDVEFDELIKNFNNKVKYLILLGQTKEKIKESAVKYGFMKNYFVKDMKEAVKVAYDLSEKGDNILLSPACASWGMYKNFEVRGRAFKEAVYDLREE